MKYSVLTFGCRVNQADSLGVEEELLANGARPASLDDADIVVVNTCSVTASADQAARQSIRRIARINPSARIVVTGCYATRQPDDVRALPGVVDVVSNRCKETVAPLAVRLSGKTPLTTAERFGAGEGACGAAIEPGVAGRTAFTLRVQTGCGEACSYCIIPATRGEPRSRPMSEVLAELARVVAAGFKEIAITGVHLGSYGRDLSPRSSLDRLIAELDAAASWLGGVSLRVSSLEPMDCTRALVARVSASENLAPHFHLPLQHASDRMLAAMRRPYTAGQYASLVDDIRTRLPHAAIGSDLIVGFPGESDADFECLIRYLERSPLTHLHVFPYSDRPGTEASTLASKVDGAVVRERARRLRELSGQLADGFRRLQIGSTHRALTIDDGMTVVTGNYLKLGLPERRPRNSWLRVRVAEDESGLRAEIVEGGKSY